MGKKGSSIKSEVTGEEKGISCKDKASVSSMQVVFQGLSIRASGFPYAKYLNSQALFGLLNPTLSHLIGSHKCFRRG